MVKPWSEYTQEEKDAVFEDIELRDEYDTEDWISLEEYEAQKDEEESDED
jgi:predicted Fe-S protein YdhL (DUF1289 family)